MFDYDKALQRLGEACMQAIIEGYEKREGIVCENYMPLQKRWEALISGKTPATWREAA
jgi:hypothetical protein